MKIARVRRGESVFLARLEGESAVLLVEESTNPSSDVVVDALTSSFDMSADGEVAPLDDVRILSSLRRPPKMLGIGLNYTDHAREAHKDPPKQPIVFAITSNSIIGPDDVIRFDSSVSNCVDYEAELAVVIGSPASGVSEEDALSRVFGYTICNDVTARDAQRADGQWARSKSFDTFTPLGPCILSADDLDDIQDVDIHCRVNGEVRQSSNTKQMIFDVKTLISYLSRTMTLEPGDVILTGTPGGVGFVRTPPSYLRGGDVVDCEIADIGTLRNAVVVD